MPTDPSGPLPQFDVTPHRSDGGGVSLAGVLQLISILCSVGVLLGLIVSFIGQWLYLIILFPLLMGIVVGWVGKKTIERYKIRKPLACGLAGFAAGCLCFTAMHYADYQRFEGELDQIPANVREVARHIDELSAEGDKLPEEIRNLIKDLRASPSSLQAFRVNGFLSFMDMMATEGVTITEVGKGGNGANLGYTGSIIYWIVEAFLLAAVAFGLMQGAAARPFCVDCDRWKNETTLLDTTHKHKPIAQAVQNGDLATLEETLKSIDPKPQKPGCFTRLTTSVCESCEFPETFEVKVIKIVMTNDAPSRSIIATISYPGEALESFETLVNRVTAPIEGLEPGDDSDATA